MSVTFDKILGTMREDNTSEIDDELALKQDKVQNNLTAIVDPTVNDDSADGYEVFSIWYNTATQEMFKCMNSTVGAAVWLLTTLTLDDLGSMATETATNYYTKTAADILYNAKAPLRPVTEKTVLIDTDEVSGNDSANTFSQIRTTWTNVKSFLKTYFDGIYGAKVQKDYITVEADSFIDGTTPPDTVELIVSTGKIPVRQFSGATDQDVRLEFQLPLDITAGSTIKFKFLGVVTNATAPAVGETIIFGLQGSSVGDSELISKANGTAVKVTYTAPADLAQYDIINSSLSTAVTVTDLVGGEWCKLLLTRDTADTYAQKIGINSLQLEISRTVLAA